MVADIQIISGVAILVSGYSSLRCGLSAYHLQLLHHHFLPPLPLLLPSLSSSPFSFLISPQLSFRATTLFFRSLIYSSSSSPKSPARTLARNRSILASCARSAFLICFSCEFLTLASGTRSARRRGARTAAV